MPEIQQSPIPRRDVVDHVERAFDLLHHYREALNHDGGGITVEERERILQQLEEVLHRWLPMALAANEPLITDVHAAIGHREEAKQLLAAPEAELWQVRAACLQRLARQAHSSPASTVTAVARCREEIRRWRDLLPYIRRRHDGQPYVDRADQNAALAVSYYWSVDLDSRPSRQGASYFLAAACDAVAAVARREGVPLDHISPALRLSHRLREAPDWTCVDAFELIRTLDEQMNLTRQVEVLLDEVDLVSVEPEGRQSALQEATTRLHGAIVGIAGSLSNVVRILGRYAEPSIALVILDRHVQFPGVDPEPDTPERAKTWQAVIHDLQAQVSTALQLWEARIEGVDGRLRLEFARTSHGSVKCGPIERNSHHEVVIAIGRLILDPLDNGAVRENELAEIGAHAGSVDTARGAARLHVVRTIRSRPWWQAMTLGLDQEYAQVVAPQPHTHVLTSFPPQAQDPGVPSPEATPTPSMVLKFPRAPDAKQKCLEALASAPDGVPRHEDIAYITGLEHQTVKEAMPVLKKAGYVEKLKGAWMITKLGREHLKVLRGE